jgi:hypothetical protein
MNDGLYHRNLGLPAGAASLWDGVLDLQYSAHAQQESRQDRNGALPLFPNVEFQASDVVEVQVERGEAVKAVLRVPMDDSRDLVYVLSRPAAGRAFVRTVWCNRANDNHRTLDSSKYVKP